MTTYMENYTQEYDQKRKNKKILLIGSGVLILLSIIGFGYIHFSSSERASKEFDKDTGTLQNKNTGNPFLSENSEARPLQDPELCTDTGTPSLVWREFPKNFYIQPSKSALVSWQTCGFLRAGTIKIVLISPENKETVLGSYKADTDVGQLNVKDVLYTDGYHLRIQNDSKNASFQDLSPAFPVVRFFSEGVTLSDKDWQKTTFKKTSFAYPNEWSLTVSHASVPPELLMPPVFKTKNTLFTDEDSQAQKALDLKWRAEVEKKGYTVDQFGRIKGKDLGYTLTPPTDLSYQKDPFVQIGDHIAVGAVSPEYAEKGIYYTRTVQNLPFSIPYSASEKAWNVFDTITKNVGKQSPSVTSVKNTTSTPIKSTVSTPNGGDALGN